MMKFYCKNAVSITLKRDNLDDVYFVQCYDFINKRITEHDFKTQTTAFMYYSVLVANWMNEISRRIPHKHNDEDVKKFAKLISPHTKE